MNNDKQYWTIHDRQRRYTNRQKNLPNIWLPGRNTTNPKPTRKPDKRIREEKMKRYKRLNEYYILDNYTGQKLDMKRTIQRLNRYETALKKENKMEGYEWIE